MYVDYLTVPGYQGASEKHWLTQWEAKNHSMQRVEQLNWAYPRRTVWIDVLDTYIMQCRQPPYLIGHSCGSGTIMAWAAAYPEKHHLIRGAFLVALPDFNRAVSNPNIEGFKQVRYKPVKFPVYMVSSMNDSICSLDKAIEFSKYIQCDLTLLRNADHISYTYRPALKGWAFGYNLMQLHRKRCNIA